jgi:hypothetical protein
MGWMMEGLKPEMGKRYFISSKYTGKLCFHSAYCLVGAGVLSQEQNRWGVMVNTYLHLMT